MLYGFGDAAPANQLKFHEGIDIRASGHGGEDVVAARAGKVVEANPDNVAEGGAYVIEVTLADGTKEWDTYLHLDNVVVRNNGDTVEQFDKLGTIGTVYDDGSRHLHYSVTNKNPSPIAFDFKFEETSLLNPFLRFKDVADRDPWQKDPLLVRSHASVTTSWLFVPNNSVADDGSVTPFKQNLSGSVDIIVDAFDPMSRGATPESGGAGLHSIGYYIRPAAVRAPKPHGIKTSADTAYKLAKFDDNWFAGKPFTNNLYKLVYADSGDPDPATKLQGLRVDPNPFLFTRNYHYIVTNTKGTDGSPANVVDAFWNTKAKERATPPDDDVADANYASDMAQAAKNAEARFMDGNYMIVAVMTDLRKTVESSVYKRVVNFQRQAGALGGPMQPQPVGTPIPAEDPPVTASFDETPPPVVAQMNGGLPAGEEVGIFGDQFYPNWVMNAYIFQHKNAGWQEGESLTDWLNQSEVRSDANGAVPLTDTGWVMPSTGTYDVVIDYGNDGHFRAGLDGLASFTVVDHIPDPLP